MVKITNFCSQGMSDKRILLTGAFIREIANYSEREIVIFLRDNIHSCYFAKFA